MGVHGLWELLAPVGRRVSVETLAGKKLAIDASIWMIQFMKAMRDERGEMVRNAHILGFFRRICKLLFLRTKPVFVFDGGTPALKRRTVVARRRQRENAQGKIRKTAEKLLLNHLKAMRLKELAKDLEKQRQSNDVKGKKVVVEEPVSVQEGGEGNDEGAMSLNQEELDEMLAASLAAEESEGVRGDASTSGAGAALEEVFGEEDDDDDEDEELIIPEMNGNIDPAILASLPPSMQLDLLVQMRERLMAENRQKYQKVKKAPARFSELQIQAYLKTVAFRREIDGVQKSAAGRGIGGVQTSRIASEANREFIFSSSFTGDKQAFTSVGQEQTNAGQSHPSPVTLNSNNSRKFSPSKTSGSAAGPTQPETSKKFNDDVGTYTDERGCLRVNRVRALGIRMTRDLQRNLDLMKEIEQEKTYANQTDNETTAPRNLANLLVKSPERILLQEFNDKINDGSNDDVDATQEPVIMKGTSIEVSFEDTCDRRSSNEDDDLFAQLVAGEPVMDFSVDKSTSLKKTPQSTSDCEWEEGAIEDTVEGQTTRGGTSDEGEIEWEEGDPDSQPKITSYQDEKVENGDESEVEWEEEHQDTCMKSSYPDENHDIVSRGAMEEEAAFQEAIRRSLSDVKDSKSMNELPEDEEAEIARETGSLDIGEAPLSEVEKVPQFDASVTDISQPVEPTDIKNILETNNLKEVLHASMNVSNEENNLDRGVLSQDGEAETLVGEILSPLDTLPDERSSSLTRKVVMLDGSLVNSDPSHSEDAFQATLGDNALTESVGNISANDLMAEAGEFVEKKHDDISAEMESTVEPPTLDTDDKYEDIDARLEEEMLFLDKERDDLGNEQRKLERNAESVSSEMFVECQELLQMFGLPYIIAPMEAEAQCAFMELSNLVDGVVTDDSDAFLFGARSVYKNIFDDRKYVETYLMKDIENELGLDREKLIHMALLLGSDYTEGVSGIGIVNAIEVVNAFPEKDGLQEFREWIESPDPTILGKLNVKGGNSKRKLPKTGEAAMSSNLDEIPSDQSAREPQDEAAKRRQLFMDTHRNVSKNWHIPSSFPSDAVISAYASPQVDKSTEPFAWGKPDLSILRKLCWEKFSWATSKADELLLPVLKEYNKHETQLRLEAFYTFNERFAKIKSKRVKKALKGITGDKSSELVDGVPLQSGKGKKRKGKPSANEADQSGVSSSGLKSTDTGNQVSATVKPATKQSKGKLTKEKRLKVALEASSNPSTCLNSKTRGRGRGRGRGQVSGRRREENNLSSEDTETSHERDGVMFGDMSEPHEVRRSGRVRKSVNYDEFGDLEVQRENFVNEGSTANDSIGAEPAVDVIQTSADQLEEGEPNEAEVDLFSGENEQAYDTNMIDTFQTDFSPIEDHFNPSELDKDYLQSGGGFCAEEDEQNGDGTHTSSPTRELIPEESSHLNSVNNETDLLSIIAPTVNEKEQSDDVLQNDDEDVFNEPEARYTGTLRAMPNLRKKRRLT